MTSIASTSLGSEPEKERRLMGMGCILRRTLELPRAINKEAFSINQRLKVLRKIMVDDLATKGGAGYASGKGEETLRQAGIPGIKYLDQGSRVMPLDELKSRLADVQSKIASTKPTMAVDRNNIDAWKTRARDLQDQ